MTGIFYGSFFDQEKQKKPLRSLRLCLPSEIHDSEERSGFNRGGSTVLIPSEARAIFSYLAVEETGYSAADVARFLGVKRMSVHEAVTRGKALCDEYALLGQKYELRPSGAEI